MKIRLLKEFEKKEIIPVYEDIFDDSDAYVNYFHNEVLPESEVFACIVNDRITGVLCLIPKKVSVGSQEMLCHYIYGVATKTEWRRQGVMSCIIKNAINHLYLSDRGDYFTYLIPSPVSNAEIYEKYGFGAVMDKTCRSDIDMKMDMDTNINTDINTDMDVNTNINTDVDIDTNIHFQNNYSDTVLKKRAEYSDAERLSQFAEAYVSKAYGVYLTRDRHYFERMFMLMEAEGGGIDIYFVNGNIVGYRIGFDDETVEEVFDYEGEDTAEEAEDKTANGNVNRSVNGSVDEIKPYVMARIINIRKMMELMRAAEEGEVTVRVEDSVIDDNNGTYLWRYGNNVSVFERTSLESKVKISIGELASHIFGYKAVAGLPEMNVKNGVFINDYV